MTEMVMDKAEPISRWTAYKYRLAIAGATGLSLVGYASAATIDLNATLGPIIGSIVDLMPDIINLIVAIVPAVLVLAVVGFLIAFFDKILSMLKL